jgi:hypothetical protein
VFSCRRSLTDDADSRRSTIDLDATPVGESSNGYIGKFRVVPLNTGSSFFRSAMVSNAVNGTPLVIGARQVADKQPPIRGCPSSLWHRCAASFHWAPLHSVFDTFGLIRIVRVAFQRI